MQAQVLQFRSVLHRGSELCLQHLLPESCAACGSFQLERGRLLCDGCAERSRGAPWGSVGQVPAIAPFRYQDPISSVIRHFKYDRQPELGRRLSVVMADYLRSCVPQLLSARPCLVPVPVHPKRIVERGYNQAALLALALGRELQLPVRPRALMRRSHTPRQATLGAAERRQNLQSQITARQPLPTAIVLIDDVLTTGATANACIEAARAAGATPLAVATIAIAP